MVTTLSEGFAIGLGLAGFVISLVTLVLNLIRERTIGPLFTAVDPKPKLTSTKNNDKLWEV